MSNIERFVVLSVALMIGIVGCSKLPARFGPGPTVSAIPLQEASTGVELRVNLSDFVENPDEQTLSWQVLSGPGSIEGDTYVGLFDQIGSVDVSVRVANRNGNSSDADFKVVALHGYMAVVQNGHGLEVLDGGTGTVSSIEVGGNLPLVFRDVMPDGSLIYERMGGSGIDLFHYDHKEVRRIGQGLGLNTVYDNHTPSGQIFFEEGTASETGLYLWNPDGESTTRIARRPSMHNRNAFFSPPDVVYFEFGNNGQSDIYFWRIGIGDPATAYSSDHSEEIKAVLPDGGVVFSTKGLGGEDELLYYRMGQGVFTVGGDLPTSVQDQDMTYVTLSSQGLVVFETGTTSRDLWVWNAPGLTTSAVAATSADERFEAMTSDDLIVYSVTTAPGNNDLKIYNYSVGASTDIGASAANEVFEHTLSDSDVIYAVETATNRSLYRFDVATNTVDAIAESVGESYATVAVLTNDRLVYSRTGAPSSILTWNPATGTSVLAGGADSTFAGQGPNGGFVMHVVAFGQTDLALWDGTSGQVVTIAQSPQEEHFEAAFGNGAVIYSVVVPPKTTTDLFQWRDGAATRMTDGSASHSVVRVLRGDF